LAAQEAAAQSQLDGMLQLRGEGSNHGLQQPSKCTESRPETPWMFQVCVTLVLCKRALFCLYTSMCMPFLGTNRSFSYIHLFGPIAMQDDNQSNGDSIDIVNTSASSSRLGTPLSVCLAPQPRSPQGGSRPWTPLHCLSGGSSAGDQESKLTINHEFWPSHTPFTRQAAPMVLSIDDPTQSTDVVLGLELQKMSLEQLRQLNSML